MLFLAELHSILGSLFISYIILFSQELRVLLVFQLLFYEIILIQLHRLQKWFHLPLSTFRHIRYLSPSLVEEMSFRVFRPHPVWICCFTPGIFLYSHLGGRGGPFSLTSWICFPCPRFLFLVNLILVEHTFLKLSEKAKKF